MNIPTPRTNAATSENIVKVYETSLQLETELTTALAEIDRLDVAGIHSCHANCQKSMCVMRRELTSATEQRDEMTRYANKLAHGFPDGMLPKDVEVLREANLGLAVELTAVTEQQNELKEENKHLKDQLATLSKTHATDMQRLSDMIDERQEALRYISEIIEEKSAEREDLELGSTAYKTVRRRASFFLDNSQTD
jgi:hypothetical protein